jgi:outer membrane protein OmpA-like peptidoglycan-associated protein
MTRFGLLLCALLVCAPFAAGCGKTIAFKGETAVPYTPAPAKIKRVVTKPDRIVITEKIQFDVDRATIRPESFGIIDEVAAAIRKQPDIRRLQVQGHASSEGDPVRNQTLSEERAASVMNALVERGISAAILTSAGFGASQPVADNDSQEGREKNRRVEFLILERAKAEEAE